MPTPHVDPPATIHGSHVSQGPTKQSTGSGAGAGATVGTGASSVGRGTFGPGGGRGGPFVTGISAFSSSIFTSSSSIILSGDSNFDLIVMEQVVPIVVMIPGPNESPSSPHFLFMLLRMNGVYPLSMPASAVHHSSVRSDSTTAVPKNFVVIRA
jgi:hypothetical protein